LQNKKLMHFLTRQSQLITLLALVAGPNPLASAAATAFPTCTGSAASAKGSDKGVSLSPFTAQAASETGYWGTSSLAGSKLNTPLRAIGVGQPSRVDHQA